MIESLRQRLVAIELSSEFNDLEKRSRKNVIIMAITELMIQTGPHQRNSSVDPSTLTPTSYVVTKSTDTSATTVAAK